MSLTSEIYDAIATRLQAFATDHALPVAYPGISFTPPDAGQWLELRVFWNGAENYGLADSGPSIEMGFFRVVICQRPGPGIMPIQALAETVMSAIPKGATLGPARVYRAPSLSGPFQEDERDEIPVTVYWRATR